MSKEKWVLDPTHSELGFKIKHLMISNISGSFKDFQVELSGNVNDLTRAEINLSAEMISIFTNNEQRDAHLRNSDFFEADKFPKLTFTSSKIEKVDDENYVVFGDLTLKGVTKPVKLNVESTSVVKDPWGMERTAFVVSGKLNRSEWGVTFNSVLETGGVALGEEVRLHSEIEMVKQAVSVAA